MKTLELCDAVQTSLPEMLKSEPLPGKLTASFSGDIFCVTAEDWACERQWHLQGGDRESSRPPDSRWDGLIDWNTGSPSVPLNAWVSLRGICGATRAREGSGLGRENKANPCTVSVLKNQSSEKEPTRNMRQVSYADIWNHRAPRLKRWQPSPGSAIPAWIHRSLLQAFSGEQHHRPQSLWFFYREFLAYNKRTIMGHARNQKNVTDHQEKAKQVDLQMTQK